MTEKNPTHESRHLERVAESGAVLGTLGAACKMANRQKPLAVGHRMDHPNTLAYWHCCGKGPRAKPGKGRARKAGRGCTCNHRWEPMDCFQVKEKGRLLHGRYVRAVRWPSG